MNNTQIHLLILLLCSTSICLAQDYKTKMTVAQDGSGDFTSIQAAIAATKAFPDERFTLYVMNGIYKEKVTLYFWNTHVSLIGENRDSTIITFDDNFNRLNKGRNSTFHSYTFLVDDNDFHAENLTIENSSGPVGQSVALHIAADRVSFTNCTIKGYQDTMCLAGEGFRSHFKNCFISGSTDFIFGEGTALFEDCEIHSHTNSYITAASTPENIDYGFVFKNCTLTAATDMSEVYIGRPWRKYARTVFIDCELGAYILPEGWDNWGKETNEKTAFYSEYGSYGPGANLEQRVSWSHKLTLAQMNEYTREHVLSGW